MTTTTSTAENTTVAEHPFTPDDVALEWVSRNFSAQHSELIKAHPWSKVFRLQGQQEVAYLKLVPDHEREVLAKSRLISRTFPGIVPEVTASDTELGLLMTRDFAAIPLDDAPSEVQLRKLLLTYADMQTTAARDETLQQGLPWFNLQDTIDEFFSFLDPETTVAGEVGADFFLDPLEASGYAKALGVRRRLLEGLLARLAPLPPTLNHCDLNAENAAERADGTMIIFDWDDAIIGPAGLSLHLLLGGCARVHRLLNGDPEIDHEAPHLRRLFSAWANRLALGGYADYPTLLAATPAAVCAGAMRSIRLYGRFPSADKDYRNAIADVLRERLEDLLQLCDLLTLDSRNETVAFATDYLENGVPWRAIHLVDRYVAGHPNDVDMQRWAGDLHMASGQWPEAIDNYLRLVEARPELADAHHLLGLALLKSGQAELSIEAFETALKIEPDHADAARGLQRAQDISRRVREAATMPQAAPSIRLSDEEREANTVDSENLDYALRMFHEHGYVVVENLFPKALVTTVSDEFFKRYNSYFEDRLYPDNLILGDKRRMVSVALEGVLNSPRLYGSTMVVEMMKRLLGEDYVMGGYNAVVSLPGARDKGLHKDYTPLFESDPVEHHVTPPFAISVLFPLIELTEAHGVTSMRKGTHLLPEEMPFDAPEQKPLLKLGDAIIFDYRVAHDGLANHSDTVRPLLSMIFHRVWFRDALNYVHQKAVMIEPEEYQRVPEHLQHLFRWAQADNAEPKTDAREYWRG